jgi:predicted DNA-binding protein with PD1-like motif
MEKARKGNLLTVRLFDGEDLLEELKTALRDEGIDSGVILGGVGMVMGAALSFYKGRGEYHTVPLSEAAELCSLNGNISTLDGELIIHTHAIVGKKGGAAMAGHLSSAKVHMTAEIAILAAEQKLVRKLDPETGLRTLAFQ